MLFLPAIEASLPFVPTVFVPSPEMIGPTTFNEPVIPAEPVYGKGSTPPSKYDAVRAYEADVDNNDVVANDADVALNAKSLISLCDADVVVNAYDADVAVSALPCKSPMNRGAVILSFELTEPLI